MKIAVIPPHRLLVPYGTMGDEYHLCLSSEILSIPAYAQFYRDRRLLGDHVILDNSAHEQLEGQTIEQLQRAIDYVVPTEVVLPDRLFFGDDTLQRSTEALVRFGKRYKKGSIAFMGVPQGRVFHEWDRCLVGLKSIGVDTIGISKDYEVWDGGLARLVSAVQSRGFPPDRIHLLGWGRELWQLTDLHDQVRGVDSAKPFVYALNGVLLPDEPSETNTPTYPRRKTDYFHAADPDDDLDRRIVHNIGVFRRVARGEACQSVRSL